jgi:hypothetical protein
MSDRFKGVVLRSPFAEALLRTPALTEEVAVGKGFPPGFVQFDDWEQFVAAAQEIADERAASGSVMPESMGLMPLAAEVLSFLGSAPQPAQTDRILKRIGENRSRRISHVDDHTFEIRFGVILLLLMEFTPLPPGDPN